MPSEFVQRSLRVELNVSAYFVLYPVSCVNPSGPDVERYRARIPSFKLYLENKGALLSGVAELQEFCLLPYVGSPLESSFRKMLAKEWVEEVRKELNDFLAETLPELGTPKIYELIPERNGENSSMKLASASIVKSRNKNSKDIAASILKVSKDLLSSIIATINGERVEKAFIDNAKTQIASYEAAINHKATKAINYAQIKEFLRESTNEPKLIHLFKALRHKAVDIKECVRVDLLDCSADCEVLERVLEHNNSELVLAAIKFVRVILSGDASYLVSQAKPLKIIFKVFASLVSFYVTPKYAKNPYLMKQFLPILVGCSSIRKGQTILIELQLVQWIVNAFRSECDKYCAECLTHILLNLVISAEGSKIARDPDLGVMRVLVSLLAIESEEVRSCVNGTLYWLLNFRDAKRQARVMVLCK